jgi:hypothetical protein
MMDEYGVEAAKLHETANLRLRRWHLPIYNALDFLCRNGNFPADTL